MIKDIFQRKTESSIPCESLQQLQRQQQASRVRGKGKHYPWPRNARKTARELKGWTRKRTPTCGRPCRHSSPGWARLTPRQSSGAPCQAPRLPPQSLAEAGRRSPRAESAPREDNKDWEVNEDRQATCWMHAQEPPTKMTSTRPGEATVTGLLLRKKLF